jgi:putative oxidoreductase
MLKQLDKYQAESYAALRIVAGVLFAFHGMQKILGVLTEWQPEMFSQLWIGGLIELVGGLAIAAGFQTRLFAFLASGTMAVAYFQFHWKFQFDQNFWPIMNKGELAAIYSFLFLFIATRGAGKWALDKS